MKLINRIQIFLSQKPKTQLLFIEAFILLGWARKVKEKPFAEVAPLLGMKMDETAVSTVIDKKAVKEVASAVNVMSRYTFWESMCLVKAIAAMKMLERRKIESTLYLGTAKDENGKLIAHAWLRSGPYYLTGSEEMKRFTVVGKFAKKISKAHEGETYE
ncbi:lasso peptide biosynthesis B2 protein [Metabacillus elymi]|uniref:Lasso peptide biosynthesis B2 protein n=1 Tax=Metabacillus elymi TaxID=2745198 RepID=A0ABX6RXE1_9BACI|nr:lasso peptide biosynthesis B2 protein [Metabacillus sp. KUDC1714]QNF26179.1 lasso peptide biosynthesis B2 protein [Metabacillus sp. KUDC1714]